VTRLAYLGTPTMAVPPLRALVVAGLEVAAVVTRIDKRRGRGSELIPSPVKVAAIELGIPVLHRVDDLLDLGVDRGVVVAFGQIIKPHVLAAIPMVNLHFSLLPRWRGAAPVERALLAGDAVTGVCLMALEEGLDTGPVYERREVPIGSAATADDLRETLVDVGTEMLVAAMRDGLPVPVPQLGDPTYAEKLRAEEYRIDWASPPEVVHRLVRLGGAYTTFRGKRLRVVSAEPVQEPTPADPVARSCGELVGDVVCGLRLRRVQPEGKAPMGFADFARGARPRPGERLGE
jgi:methionyl-tRNA formyltransferase